MTTLQVLTESTAKELANKMDEAILELFGSEELFRTYAHLYVVETEPTIMEAFTMHDSVNSFKLRTETRMRIRPKTLAELEAENIHV